MQLSKDFRLQEFIPKEVYDLFGDKSIWFLDPKLPVVVQKIRDLLGKPIIINNWHLGGQNNYCGFRSRNCTVGANDSQHRMGRALDLHVQGYSPDQFRQFIRDYFSILQPLGLTTIEQNTPTWLHIDCRWTGLDNLLEIPFQ